MKLSSQEIREYIKNKITAHFQCGEIFITIISGDIQKELGINNCTPQVCGAMRKAAEIYLHQVIFTPFKGDGTRLKIRYYKDEAAKIAEGKIETIVGQPKNSETDFRRPKDLTSESESKDSLPNPTVEQVRFYLREWKRLSKYIKQESALTKLFHYTYPENKQLDEVLIKACALNTFYSTNIFDIVRVAEHIVGLNIDDALKNGDLELVNKLARIDNTSNNNYSFATKYCSHHYPDNYAIYDSFVHRVLVYFRKADNFFNFEGNDLKEYSKFHKVILEFRRFYGLDEF